MKSEKLKKLELELQDLEQWLRLDLVPKRDIEKHRSEIAALRKKIEGEQARLQNLKESGDSEDLVMHKKSVQQRMVYQDSDTLSGVEMEEEESLSDSGLEQDLPTNVETGGGTIADDDESVATTVDDEDDPFSDKNRWRRGILEDPDADTW